MTRSRYQIWEFHPERPDRLFAEFSGYAAAVKSITHAAVSAEAHSSPLAWALRESSGKVLLKRQNCAWNTNEPKRDC